jgi:hypothetical protein
LKFRRNFANLSLKLIMQKDEMPMIMYISGMSGVTGAALREASHINKSLSALADVLGALAEQSRSHVPYRNSRLTHFLQDSIGKYCTFQVFSCMM